MRAWPGWSLEPHANVFEQGAQENLEPVNGHVQGP